MEDKDNNKRPRYNLLRYYLISILAVFALNWLILPMVTQNSIEGSSYSDFRNNLSQNKIEEVSFKQDQILYKLKDDKKIYKTGKMEDPEIVKDLEEKGVEYSSEIPEKPSLFMNFIMTWGFPILLFFLLQRAMTKRMQNLGGSGILGGGKKIKKYEPSGETVDFDDVAGQEEAEESLVEIVDYLKNPKKYTDIGAKCPKGALLVGPPGTGKTLLARAVAGESHVPFFSIAGSEFVEMFAGRGAAKVRELFEEAKKNAPCIIFIDEIDTIGKRRDGAGISGNDEREQTLNQLLSEMDGFDAKAGVVILAATNRPDSLDPALLRPGRFDRRIPVELPDLSGRTAILKVHAKNIKKEEAIDFEKIARATAGASGADLANMINEAALRAVREGRDKMSERDLEESVEVVLAGYEKKNAVISPKEKRIIAYHEVGHALVAAKQKDSAPVHKITIIPRTSGALGYTMQVDEEEKFLMTKEDAINSIVTLTGGRSAEELIFNIRTSGASNDIEKATKIAKAMVTRFGMTDEFGFVALESMTNAYLGGDTSLQCSPQTQYEIDEAVQKIIDHAHDEARKILKENIKALHAIAEYLLRQETITGEEFMDILKEYDKKEIQTDFKDELESID